MHRLIAPLPYRLTSSRWLLAFAAASIAMLAIGCGLFASVPAEVRERREVMDLVQPYDKRQIDGRTVAVFTFCGGNVSETENPEEHQRIDEIVEHIGDWHLYTYYALYDLDSAAYIEVGGDWGFVGPMERAGPKEALERLSAIVDDEEESMSLVAESFDESRCPFHMQENYDPVGLEQLPETAAERPIRDYEINRILRPDTELLTGPAWLIYYSDDFYSDDFNRMGFDGENELSHPTEIELGPNDGRVLLVSSELTPEEAAPFLQDEGYEERRTTAGSAYFASETLQDEAAFRKFIYFSVPERSGVRRVAFSEDESAIIELIEVWGEQDRTIGRISPLGIVVNAGLREAIDAISIYTLLTPEAVIGSSNVEWLSAGLAWGEVENQMPAIGIALYFEKPGEAAEKEGWLAEQIMEFEAGTESQPAGIPARPFEEWCETLETVTRTNIDGSVLTATCVMHSADAVPPWTTLVDNGDLGFLW